MAEHNELGKAGEQIACKFFVEKGCKILEKNWRSGKYEIDLIVVDRNELVVVEVKTRTSNQLMEPETSVTREKQRMLVQAAHLYVQRNNIDKAVRFDIISIIIAQDNYRIKHIADAFYPTIY